MNDAKTMKRKPWWRMRNIVLAVGVVFLGLIAFIGYHVHWALTVEPNIAVDYVAELEKLASEGQPEGENGWEHIERAIGIFEEVEGEFDAVPYGSWGAFELDFSMLNDSKVDESDQEKIEQALAMLVERGAFEAIEDAAKCPRFVCPRGPAKTPAFNILLPHLRVMRRLAQADCVLLRRGVEAGDVDAVVMSFDRIMCLSRASERQLILIEHLVGLAMTTLAENEIRRAHVEDRLTPDLAQALLDRVRSWNDAPTCAQAIDVERFIMEDLVQRMFSDDGDGNGVRLVAASMDPQALDLIDSFDEGLPRILNLMGHFRASRVEVLTVANMYYDGVREYAEKPPSEWDSITFDEHGIATELRELDESLGMVLPALSRATVQSWMSLTHWRALELLLAIEVYKGEHGRYPDALEDLTPGLFDVLPIDPFTNGSFHYRLTEDGASFILYSSGADGVDNGGTYDPAEPMNGHFEYGAGLDVVYTAHPDPEELESGDKETEQIGDDS